VKKVRDTRERLCGRKVLGLMNLDFDHEFVVRAGKLRPLSKDATGLNVEDVVSIATRTDARADTERRTSGKGLPCNCAFMFHGRSGLPYSRRTSFVQREYRSSVSSNSPSMSKRQLHCFQQLLLDGRKLD
jgi:hypothetical protein